MLNNFFSVIFSNDFLLTCIHTIIKIINSYVRTQSLLHFNDTNQYLVVLKLNKYRNLA